MKLAGSTLRTQGVCRNALKNFCSSFSTNLPSNESPTCQSRFQLYSSLFGRISKVTDPDVSIVPVLDQWVSEERRVTKLSLNNVIKTLKNSKRFKHALEISEWMADKRHVPSTNSNIRERLDLTYKVHGFEKAEEFYNNTSLIFKGYIVDTCLLKIYCLERLEDKAEATMQNLRETGLIKTPLAYDMMLNLYCNVGSYEKLVALTNEMEKNGLNLDKYSYIPRLKAYGDNGNIEGLNKIMKIMEAKPRFGRDADMHLAAAKAFFKVGLVEKSLELLKKAEEITVTARYRFKTLNILLRRYALIGKKGEVERIWSILKKDKVFNMDYKNMISSLLILDDVEGAERIFKEWETTGLLYNFRVSSPLIDAYVKKGELGKAEAILNSGIEKGCNPSFRTWYCLTIGFIEDGQVLKGVDALKNAVLSPWVSSYEEPVKAKSVIIVECLEGKHNVEETEGLMKSLVAEGIFSSTVCERLVDFIVNKTS